MKNLLAMWRSFTWLYCLVILLLFAPPAGAVDDPFDLTLENRNYQPISGDRFYIPFSHPQDPQATPPQLNTLIENNGRPEITSLYQVYDWDGEYYDRPQDLPDQYDFAPVVGFGTQAGQNILVPASGYDIGGGYEVMVLYADNNSLTLNYTADGTITRGYTLHLENFQVDPRLVALYNRAAADRNDLPVLMAGSALGQASTNEILVAIRDSGSFMDPRWLEDWWHSLDPATAQALQLELMALLAGGPKSQCPVEESLKDEALTKGESFPITLTSWFGSYNDPNQAAAAITAKLKTTAFDIADNQPMIQPLSDTLERLTPYHYTNLINNKTTQGKITYEVCEAGTTNWFMLRRDIDFQAPGWWNRLKTTGNEVAARIVPAAGQVRGLKTEQPALLAQSEAGSIPHGCKYFYADSYGNCDCLANGTCRGEHGCCPNHWWWGICGWEDCQPQNRCSAGELQSACPGDVFGPGLPQPTPRLCQPYQPEGGDLPPQPIPCVAGECSLETSFINSAYQQFQAALQQFGGQVAQIPRNILEGLANAVGVRQVKTYWVTPLKFEPHTAKIDQSLRQESFSPFNILGHQGSEKAFEFENALEDSTQQWEASPAEATSSALEIYGQKGVKDSYDWVQKSLTPYRNLPR